MAGIVPIPATNKEDTTRFAQMWNKIITTFREEYLISNRERDLLLMPCHY
ncbi:putative 1,3-beta-glucan synthase [Helianthus annuus]|nr:putative 1,3-beta-glucan synthase [Helianthus annuus]